MISRGVLIAGFFMLIAILYGRKQSYSICKFTSLAKMMPKFAIIFSIIMLGLIGLPLTSGFIGEFLSLLAMFKINSIYAFFGGIEIVLSAIYMLNLYRNIFFKKSQNDINLKLKDLCFGECFSLVFICSIVIVFGIYPKHILNTIDQSTQKVMKIMYKKSILEYTKVYLEKSNLIKGAKFGNN